MVTDFLRAARVARALLGHPAVAERWGEASALTGYTVGGLCAHTARAATTVRRYLDGPEPESGEALDAPGYFHVLLSGHDPVDSDLHRRVRGRGEELAEQGPQAVLAGLDEDLAALERELATTPADHRLAVRDGLVIPLDEYLATRVVELVLHVDDVAVSVGLDTPELPTGACESAAATLAVLAARQHGGLDACRALGRAERHPEPLRAL